MRPSHSGIVVLCTFFILVFIVAFISNPQFPLLIMAGESSVGTWMSGVLLIVSATISLIIGMRQQRQPWYIITVFFMILALDERFMFHEKIKEHLIFSYHQMNLPRFIYEAPVILGACVGAFFTFVLWRNIQGVNRVLLLCAVVLGIASVAIDILAAGVLWEEIFKLIAELLICCALLRKVAE
jgi:hypothetical protein